MIPRRALIYINNNGADVYRIIGRWRLRSCPFTQYFEPGKTHEIRDKKDQNRSHHRTGL